MRPDNMEAAVKPLFLFILLSAFALTIAPAAGQERDKIRERGYCRHVAPMKNRFIRTELPADTAAEDIWITRRGKNLDRDNDGLMVTGRYIVTGLATPRTRRTTVYVSIFRDDKRGGRFCFTLKWRR